MCKFLIKVFSRSHTCTITQLCTVLLRIQPAVKHRGSVFQHAFVLRGVTVALRSTLCTWITFPSHNRIHACNGIMSSASVQCLCFTHKCSSIYILFGLFYKIHKYLRNNADGQKHFIWFCTLLRNIVCYTTKKHTKESLNYFPSQLKLGLVEWQRLILWIHNDDM